MHKTSNQYDIRCISDKKMYLEIAAVPLIRTLPDEYLQGLLKDILFIIVAHSEGPKIIVCSGPLVPKFIYLVKLSKCMFEDH